MDEPASLDVQSTLVTPISIEATRLDVRAHYFNAPLELEALRALYPPAQTLWTDPLVLKISNSAYVVALPFGAVVFWQCNDAVRSKVIEEIKRLPQTRAAFTGVSDDIAVLVNQSEDRVNFRDIWLRILTLEHIRTISEVFGRSVALKQSESSVTEALKNTAPIVHALESRGALIPSAKNIRKTVGFTLAVREAILVKLSLFDDPAETWQSERLARLHHDLYEHFDIKKRLSALQEKVTFLSDLNLLLMELLQNRTSHRLEFIVILLIVIEVIFTFYHFFTGK